MKSLILIISLVALSSCGLFKKTEVIKDRIVRDSVIVINTVHIDTLLVKRDTFSGFVPFSILQQLGEMTFRGDRTTTKIIYRDGNIGFETDSDSLLQLAINKVSTLEKYMSDKSNETTTTEIIKKPFNWGGLIAVLALILLIVIAVLLIILKLKR